MAHDPSSRTRIVLFDIDGTLLLTGGAGMRAMTRTFEDMFKVRDAFAGIPMPGRTDSIILADALARLHMRVDDDALRQFRDRYCAALSDELARPAADKRVLPGVRNLLDQLDRRDHVFLALLSGNFTEAARIKLEHFGLAGYFACGAYGDDAKDRDDLLAVAVERTREHGVTVLELRDVLVVGDTPLDVRCARAAGAVAVAVATGNHDAEALRASGAEVVFDDLRDAERFLRLVDN